MTPWQNSFSRMARSPDSGFNSITRNCRTSESSTTSGSLRPFARRSRCSLLRPWSGLRNPRKAWMLSAWIKTCARRPCGRASPFSPEEGLPDSEDHSPLLQHQPSHLPCVPCTRISGFLYSPNLAGDLTSSGRGNILDDVGLFLPNGQCVRQKPGGGSVIRDWNVYAFVTQNLGIIDSSRQELSRIKRCALGCA